MEDAYGFSIVAGSTGWAAFGLRRHPVASLGVLAYWLLFALTSSLLPLRSLATDYRQYPSLVFALLAAAALGASHAPRAGAALATVLIAYFAGPAC